LKRAAGEPLLSVSGLRGIYGESLTEKVAAQYTRAFASLYGYGNYVVARDTRPHGESLRKSVVNCLTSMGCDVMDLYIVPTPTLVFNVRESDAKGGIMISASHNPIEWNALKLVKHGGIMLSPKDIDALQNERDDPTPWANPKPSGEVRGYPGGLETHIESIIYSKYVARDKLLERKFKVGVDAVNGAAFEALPQLLRELGCAVKELNCRPDKPFPHGTVPNKENLKKLDSLLLKGSLDLGFGTDPDGDRLIFGVKGVGLLTEEHTLPVAASWFLRFCKSPVVTNLSSSMMIEDVAKAHGVKVIRTKVGEVNVISEMHRSSSLFGGEGNGGIIFPELNQTRDGLVGAALILSKAATEGLEGLTKGLRDFGMLKSDYRRKSPFQADELVREFEGGKVDTRDGVYVRFSESWIHIRSSNTEPLIRVYSEGPNMELVKGRVKQAERALKKHSFI
jgi:phosphomannomutase